MYICNRGIVCFLAIPCRRRRVVDVVVITFVAVAAVMLCSWFFVVVSFWLLLLLFWPVRATLVANRVFQQPAFYRWSLNARQSFSVRYGSTAHILYYICMLQFKHGNRYSSITISECVRVCALNVFDSVLLSSVKHSQLNCLLFLLVFFCCCCFVIHILHHWRGVIVFVCIVVICLGCRKQF